MTYLSDLKKLAQAATPVNDVALCARLRRIASGEWTLAGDEGYLVIAADRIESLLDERQQMLAVIEAAKAMGTAGVFDDHSGMGDDSNCHLCDAVKAFDAALAALEGDK